MVVKRMQKMFAKSTVVAGLTLLVLMSMVGSTKAAPDSRDAKLDRLEKHIMSLSQEVARLREEMAADKKEQAEQRATMLAIQKDVQEVKSNTWLDPSSWTNKFTLGGYGEMHANFGESGSSDQFDLHRLVLYIGYDFNEWIKLHSEFEIEHAFVSSGSGGEVVVEQMYLDFLLDPMVNVRVGRILTPLGIINKTHEPPTFNGVERPSFAKYIIPTTWSSDGVGIFGTLAPWLNYEVYVVGALDGSGFNSKDGIRKGRMKERPGLHEPAVTGRLDFFPLANQKVANNQKLRVGLSGYYGGLDNENQGSKPGANGDIFIYSADFEYTISDFDFRGAIAHEIINNATSLGSGTASQIFGFYVEGAYHFMPDAWKTGKLKEADAVVFVRYDVFDTQHKMPSGVTKNPEGDRSEFTFGVGFYPIPNLVLKADYQIRQDDTTNELDDKLNVGLGWSF